MKILNKLGGGIDALISTGHQGGNAVSSDCKATIAGGRPPYYVPYGNKNQATLDDLIKLVDPRVYEEAMPNIYEFGVLCAGLSASVNEKIFTKRYYAEFLVENSLEAPSHQKVQDTFADMEKNELITKTGDKMELPQGRHRDIFALTAKGLDVATRCGEVVRIVLSKAA